MKKLLLLTLPGFLFFLLSCEKDELTEQLEDQSCNIVEITDNITEPTTWEAGNVYVINNRNISVRSVLTIEPGVVVKLKDARIDVVNGVILAKGTATNRIVFTSLADDRYCGDTNGDGVATEPRKGDWKQINFNGTNGTVFQYVDFLYAGGNSGGFYNAINASGSTSTQFTFDNCVFAHTLSATASFFNNSAFYGGSTMIDPEISVFTNNVFYDNGRPLMLNAYYTLNTNNKFYNPKDPSQTNTENGIYITAPNSPNGAVVSWNITEVPYVLDEWFQGSTQTINIGPGAVVKFMRAGAGLVTSQNRIINISPSAILTSYKDDEHGGDTNGDGNESSPAVGDWRGVYNSSLQIFIESANIKYAANK
ncbi:MAG: hypothetical protein PHV53_00385 [Fermentimonas sp.]|nr:hypothetical protein [Fermentimonas sp.]